MALRKLKPSELVERGFTRASERWLDTDSGLTLSKRQYQKLKEIGQYTPPTREKNAQFSRLSREGWEKIKKERTILSVKKFPPEAKQAKRVAKRINAGAVEGERRRELMSGLFDNVPDGIDKRKWYEFIRSLFGS